MCRVLERRGVPAIQYGLPLDSRADYTKLDWSIWTATLALKPEEFKALIDPIAK
ncbi:MAG TPA: DUF1793 domain-containing protein [Acidobacteriaceae bacterium]|nr:DUF1793 domain-containing protein [Acidobacteriaceae bacterium]